jgi:hypothetical protein
MSIQVSEKDLGRLPPTSGKGQVRIITQSVANFRIGPQAEVTRISH